VKPQVTGISGECCQVTGDGGDRTRPPDRTDLEAQLSVMLRPIAHRRRSRLAYGGSKRIARRSPCHPASTLWPAGITFIDLPAARSRRGAHSGLYGGSRPVNGGEHVPARLRAELKVALTEVAPPRGARRKREASYGWVACLVRRGTLLAAMSSVSWLVPARSWASSSR
jgi:hypothetical protein